MSSVFLDQNKEGHGVGDEDGGEGLGGGGRGCSMYTQYCTVLKGKTVRDLQIVLHSSCFANKQSMHRSVIVALHNIGATEE